jgi:futalosine hydrolase
VSRRVLVATAVAAERDAVTAGLPAAPRWLTVAAVGVGPAAAAAGTARLLALAEASGRPYQAVVSAGIAGGFAGRAAVGAVVLATRSVQADLGADSPEGFLPLDLLGFGSNSIPTDDVLRGRLSGRLPTAVVGEVLTLATVTGTGERAAALAAEHPGAVAEAMEGFGVASAAAAVGAAFAELRTISNVVGPRDRTAWQVGPALAALTRAAPAIVESVEPPAG